MLIFYREASEERKFSWTTQLLAGAPLFHDVVIAQLESVGDGEDDNGDDFALEWDLSDTAVNNQDAGFDGPR